MDHRFSLRFESGERAGETVPIQGQGFTIGRRPGRTLQILDNSVSGQHAEISVDADGATLRDLGSTNGTRVDGERVIETRLAPGARVHFGNVELVFLDATSAHARGASAPPAPAVSGAASGAVSPGTGGSGDTLLRVSPETLARSRKRSILGIPSLVGLAVLVGGAAGLWFFLGRSAEASGPENRPARASPANLLGEDFSFENEPDGWQAAEGAPAAFLRSAQGAVSGGLGLLADLAPGDWALHRSREVHAEPGRRVTARARLRVEGGALAQIGIELAPPGAVSVGGGVEGGIVGAGDAAGTAIAWSESHSNAASGAREFESVELTTLVPPGYETARLLILGRAEGTGSVAADDVELSAPDGDGESSSPRSLSVRDYQLVSLGDPSRSAVLSRLGRTLLSLVAFAKGSSIPETAGASPLAARIEETRVAITSAGSDSDFCLRAEPALVRAGLATIGADGYSTHGLDFEREGVTSLLVGKGAELVRVIFAEPVALQGVAEGQASRICARGAVREVSLQLDFTEERKKAGDLAYAARNAEKKGDLGECLARWAELLNGFPFEEQLVLEAEAKRGALVQQGLSELQAVRAEVERARFFRLVDLYRQCRRKAADVGARFQGSEVDAESQKVVAEVDRHLSGFEAELARAERRRLEAILAGLQARNAVGLAAEVREHLEKLPVPGAESELRPTEPKN